MFRDRIFSRPFVASAGLLLILAAVACAPAGGSALPTVLTPSAAAPAIPAKPTVVLQVNVATSYYPVLGNSTEALFEYLNTRGPITSEGERAVGLATAKPRREWKPATGVLSCAIESMTITVEISLTLPRLDASVRLNAATLRNWQAFAAGVEAHERRHVQIYAEGFEEMRRLIESIGSRRDCGLVEAEIANVWATQLAVIDARQEQFHVDEDRRVQAARAPLRDQIEATTRWLHALAEQIAGMDATLATLRRQADELEAELAAIRADMDAITARYPGLVLPQPAYGQYQALLSRYNQIVPAYNAIATQFESVARQRQTAVAEHNRLAAVAAQLVEDYNWIQ